mgnify:CR=1 FL=1
MRVHAKESFSQSRCAEVDLRFRAVAQRLIIVKPQKAHERNFYESPCERKFLSVQVRGSGFTL